MTDEQEDIATQRQGALYLHIHKAVNYMMEEWHCTDIEVAGVLYLYLINMAIDTREMMEDDEDDEGGEG